MRIGLLTVELYLPQSQSLKHRRGVLRSIRQRLRNKFNVSVAQEPDNLWQRARMYIVGVNSSQRFLESLFSSIEDFLGASREFEVLDIQREFI